jgi:quinohemoprotein ethanol dehydrogenase
MNMMVGIRKTARSMLLCTIFLVQAPNGSAAPAAATGEPLLERTGTEWPASGHTYDEQRYSSLDQINTATVSRLGLAWYADIETKRGVEASPLMIGGILYNIEPWNITKAYDARTGRLLWRYDPQVPRDIARIACCDIVSRGLAAWNGKVIIATLDGRLIALDARTGKRIWSQQTLEPDWPYTVTGAPRIFDGKVVIGNGGADAGARGYVTAYDADTGRRLWRFYTVPGDPAKGFESEALKMAAGTWTGKYWTLGAGGTVWDSIVYDPKLKLIYIGVGNGSPWPQAYRSPGGGDNLFLSSIVAINADTGKYVWHFQTTPGEEWDYTATQPMILADLKIRGRLRHVVMQAPKNGFFYVLDRITGEFISGRNFVHVNWTTGLDTKGRPIPSSVARYDMKSVLVSPSGWGGHNWHPMSYSPKTGLVYFPVSENAQAFARDPDFVPQKGRLPNVGVNYLSRNDDSARFADKIKSESKAWLVAWDPVQQKERWRVEYPLSGSGGVLSTSGGLVFEGTIGSTFAAYRDFDGKKLWEMPVQQVPMAAPITYMLDGVQYIAVNAGWGGGLAHAPHIDYSGLTLSTPRLLVFKLGGEAKLPPLDSDRAATWKPVFTGSPEVVAKGRDLFARHCAACHGEEARGGVKDLRYASEETHKQFLAILLGGARQDRGMASFADTLSTSDAEAIHQYVIARTLEDWNDMHGTEGR